MIRAYKTRIETNNKVNTMLRKSAGVARLAYNWGLAEWKRRYEAGEKSSGMSLCKEFNAVKAEQFPFVAEVPYAVTESAFRNLDTAFKNFFRRVKQGADKAGYPKFKSKRDRRSFQLRGVKVYNDSAYLPKIGTVRLSETGYIPSDAEYCIYATINEAAGEWFLSVLVDDGKEAPRLRSGDVLGVDLGVKSAAVFSDGAIFENPKYLHQAEKKLSRLQRELSRRTGEKNRGKTKAKLARAHADVANARRHHQNAISNYATREGVGMIVLEDLNIRGMMRNHHLSKSIGDVGMYEIKRQIQYKAKEKGIEVFEADRWYASTRTCSGCGQRIDGVTLKDRVLICPDCGLIIDRDLNAARNLAALGEPPNGRGLPVELA